LGQDTDKQIEVETKKEVGTINCENEVLSSFYHTGTNLEDFPFELDLEESDFDDEFNFLDNLANEPTAQSEKILQLKLQLTNKDEENEKLKKQLVHSQQIINGLQNKNNPPIQIITKQENINKNQEDFKAEQLSPLKPKIVIEEELKTIQTELFKLPLEQKTNLVYNNKVEEQEFKSLLNSTWHPGKKDEY